MTKKQKLLSKKIYDVAICGAGPVGLSMAYLLGRAGLKVGIFEKRKNTTILPKGQYVHASTGEFFRQWGVWDLLKSSGWALEKSNGQGFYVNIAKGPVAEVRATSGSEKEYQEKWWDLSPAYPRKIPASDYEAALKKQAEKWSTVEFFFNHSIVEINNLTKHVEFIVKDSKSGSTEEINSKYLIACDGAHSFIRSQIGGGQDHGPTFGNQILVEFKASLSSTLGNDGFFHSFILDPRYSGWFGSQHPETGLWRYSFRHDEETLPDLDLLHDRIRGALGMPELSIEIIKLHRFDYSTGLLRKWQEKNIFFAGDSAHWNSPWGGFGMNSGVQDANNLAWKLDLVIKEIASPELLNTYQIERRSKALLTVKSATYNSLNYQAIIAAVLIGEPNLYSKGELSQEGKEFLQQRVDIHSDNSVLHTGYQLGTVYLSDAIIADDGSPPIPSLPNYLETTIPGVRAPHVWLSNTLGKKYSLIDLLGKYFVLIVQTNHSKWNDATRTILDTLKLPIKNINIGVGQDYLPYDDKYEKIYNSYCSEAILIRPDGFIAKRFASNSSNNIEELLLDALYKILHKFNFH